MVHQGDRTGQKQPARKMKAVLLQLSEAHAAIDLKGVLVTPTTWDIADDGEHIF